MYVVFPPLELPPKSRFQQIVEDILQSNKCSAKMGRELSKIKISITDLEWLLEKEQKYRDLINEEENMYIEKLFVEDQNIEKDIEKLFVEENNQNIKDLGWILYELGMCYTYGSNEIIKDYYKAYSYFSESNSLGNYRGIHMTGIFLVGGHGCQRNIITGSMLQITAAKLAEIKVGGDHQCAWAAAKLYQPDQQEYFCWFKKAIELDSNLAHETLEKLININPIVIE